MNALFSWGDNSSGQLGLGDITSKSSPVQIGSSSWTMVKTDGVFAIGLTTTKALFTWGGNQYGQLGDGTTTSKSTPTQIGLIGTSSWTAIGINGFNGFDSAAAIRSDGLLFTWGQNQIGQLGDGTLIAKSSPVQIGSSSWVAVDGGGLVWHAITI